MEMSRFRVVAREAAIEAGNDKLYTSIEKEIVHYDILRALEHCGALQQVAFQGGTCLRLCYGSPRYSEDLDFSCKDVNVLDTDLVTRTIEDFLRERFDTMVRVKDPKAKVFSEHASIKRWTIAIDTAPKRPDVPLQRIKLEVADVAHHTEEVHRPRVNYPIVSSSYGDIAITCQSVTEILADKLLSCASTEGYIRYRDLWDIPWILNKCNIDFEVVHELLQEKILDYHSSCTFAELVSRGAARATDPLVEEEFARQISRFLDGATNEWLSQSNAPQALLGTVGDTYDALAGKNDWETVIKQVHEIVAPNNYKTEKEPQSLNLEEIGEQQPESGKQEHQHHLDI